MLIGHPDLRLDTDKCPPEVASAILGYLDARMGRPAKPWKVCRAKYMAGHRDGVTIQKRKGKQ